MIPYNLNDKIIIPDYLQPYQPKYDKVRVAIQNKCYAENINPYIAIAQIWRESRLNYNAGKNSAGAVGLCQIKDQTKEFYYRWNKGKQKVDNLKGNIEESLNIWAWYINCFKNGLKEAKYDRKIKYYDYAKGFKPQGNNYKNILYSYNQGQGKTIYGDISLNSIRPLPKDEGLHYIKNILTDALKSASSVELKNISNAIPEQYNNFNSNDIITVAQFLPKNIKTICATGLSGDLTCKVINSNNIFTQVNKKTAPTNKLLIAGAVASGLFLLYKNK